MKKGTLVQFIGFNQYKPLHRTYVYGVRGDIVLIEHPEGLCSDDENVKAHLSKHYNLTLTKKQYFLEVKPDELVVLNADGTQLQTTKQVELPNSETFVDEVVSIQVPKSFLLNIKQYFVAQKESMDPNAEMPGIPKMFSKMLKSFMSDKRNEVLELSDYMISSVDSAMQTIQQADVENTIHPEPIADTKAIEPAAVIDNTIAPIETAPEIIQPETSIHNHNV